MSDRSAAEGIVSALHRARIDGDLNAMCHLFAERGTFEIAGASGDKPISIRAAELQQFRRWLGMMVNVFRLSGYVLISTVIEGPQIVAHWRVNIHSKITGVTTQNELVDLLEIRRGLIVAYRELFVPR